MHLGALGNGRILNLMKFLVAHKAEEEKLISTHQSSLLSPEAQ